MLKSSQHSTNQQEEKTVTYHDDCDSQEAPKVQIGEMRSISEILAETPGPTDNIVIADLVDNPADIRVPPASDEGD